MMNEVFKTRQAHDRLETLSRSPEQDVLIRRLLDAGFKMTTLDSANPSNVLIFRDRNDQRWVVRRNGYMEIAEKGNWKITSAEEQQTRRPTPLRARP